MKITCDACAAKYTIADEKVQGKVFKIRCKKCSNIIVVRYAAVAVAVAVEEPVAPLDDGMIWHIVVDQEQVGPLAAADVDDRFAAGEIDGESYIWREGLAEWSPLAQVPEFAHLVAVAAAAAAAPPATAPAASGDVFAAHASRAVAAERANAPMRSQRNESSVLFSLGTLAALGETPRTGSSTAAGAAGAAAQGGSEGSGLIDIRSMAGAYLGSNKAAAGSASASASASRRVGSMDDIPVFATGGFSEPAVIIPLGEPRSNRMLYTLLAAVSLIALLAAALVIVIVDRKDRAGATPALVAQSTRPPEATTPPAPTERSAAPTTPPVPAVTPTPREPAVTPATPTAPAPTAPARTPPRTAPRVPAAAPPKLSPKTPTAPPAVGGSCVLDEVGCLLAERRPACCAIYGDAKQPTRTGPRPPAPTEPTDLPEALSKPDVSAALGKVQAKVMACAATSSAKGKVQVEIKVAGSGAVTTVTVLESPDPALSSCVTSALRKATFARTQTGGKFKLPYRF